MIGILMRSIFLFIFILGVNVVYAMDIVKTWKVAVHPKPLYHRKMDQAIKVQLNQHPAYHYLRKMAHPCCRYY